MKLIIILAVVATAVLARFIPHIPNAMPITAIAIFAGAYLPKKYAVALPLAIRLFSDAIIGLFSWPLMLAVYAAHSVGILLGIWIKHSNDWRSRWMKIGSSSLIAATLFFLITNFAFLYANYPHNWTGIMASYVNGLPFFRGTVIGDVGYTVVLFGFYELVKLGAKFWASRKKLAPDVIH